MSKTLSYDELISSLSNPLQNRRLIEAILKNKAKGERANIRKLKVAGAKAPDDSSGPVSFDEAFRFESELFSYILKQYYKTIMEDRSKLNQTMITPDLLREENVAKIKELAESPVELIEVLRFDLFERGPLRDPSKTDERERAVYKKMKEKYGLNEDLTYLLASVYQNMVRFDEHIGRSGFGNLFIPSGSPYSIRIYLNTPDGKPTLEFAKEYIKKCMEKGIDYDAKFAFNFVSNDRTILYAREEDICDRVAILDEIAEEHPELIEKFGTPILDTARINDSYYGIGHAGVVSPSGSCVTTYNDYFDELCEASFVLMKARIMNQRLFFDKEGLKPGELKFVQDVSLLKKIKAQATTSGYGRQNAYKLRYFPNFDYKDGFGEDKEKTPDPVGEVFRTEGMSWRDIDKKLNEILQRKPELEAKIAEKKESGEIDIVNEFGYCMILLSNMAQERDLSAKSNVAVSKKMEERLDKLRAKEV